MPFWSFLPLSLFCEIFFCSIYCCCFSHNKFLQLKWFYLFPQETSQISLNNFFLLNGSTLIPIHTRSIDHCLYIANPGRTWTAWILFSSSSTPAASLGFARLAMACPCTFCLPSLGRQSGIKFPWIVSVIYSEWYEVFHFSLASDVYKPALSNLSPMIMMFYFLGAMRKYLVHR